MPFYQAVILKKGFVALFPNSNQFDREDAGMTARVWILSEKSLRTRYITAVRSSKL